MTSARFVWPLVLAGTLLGAGVLAYGAFTGRPDGTPSPAVTDARVPAKLYFADPQGMYLIPIEYSNRDLSADPTTWAAEVYSGMSVQAQPKLVPVVTAETILRAASWSPPLWSLTVEVQRPLGSTSERLLIGALVRTFTESWPGTKGVRLKLVDPQGEPYGSQHFDLSSPLTVADVANASDAEPAKSGIRSTLWWRTKGSETLVPVQVALPGRSGVPPQDAFAQLVAGPPAASAKFLDTVAMPAYRARWAGLEAGLATIEIAGKPPIDTDGRLFVEATVLTLTEFPDVKAVKFVHEGKPIAGTVGRFDLGQALSRPAGVNAPPAAAP